MGPIELNRGDLLDTAFKWETIVHCESAAEDCLMKQQQASLQVIPAACE